MQVSASKIKKVIGRAETIALPELGSAEVPARIDTGAKTSSIWASHMVEANGVLQFTLFDQPSPLYTGRMHRTTEFEKVIVASSNGIEQERYKVRLLLKLKGKKIRGRFTLADRSSQAYPVLIGRNVLRGKFIVDVTRGKPLYQEEHERSEQLQSKLQ
jgi:hypothetical protein